MLSIYNTLSKRIEPFKPMREKNVGMYTCGPTVYHYAHIGNFKTFLVADILSRYLRFSGFEVTHVMNITDVGHLTQDDIEQGEDKMLAAARREGKTIWDIAKQYTDLFLDELRILHFAPIQIMPKATEHISEMLDMIQTLLRKGLAYEVKGNVYFDISKFPAYGRLSGNNLEDLLAGARVEVLGEKKHPGDFALWKTDEKHLMQWEAPWGKGFPGWHIECSAMSGKYLGEQFDLHIGGEDLIFPHHESEIAQSEGASGKPFVNYWLHSHYLFVDGKKMSKRDGNFYTVRDLLDKGFSPREIRFTLTQAHYRQNFNFTLDGLQASRQALRRFDELIRRLERADAASPNSALPALLSGTEKKIRDAMNDDLNISGAWAAVFELVTELNKQSLGSEDGKTAASFLKKMDEVFGVLFMDQEKIDSLPAEDLALIGERDEARRAKNWGRADEIRNIFLARGILLEDIGGKTVWKKV